MDDKIDTIEKRLNVYSESTLPVINYYSSKGKVRKVILLHDILSLMYIYNYNLVERFHLCREAD